MGALLRGAAETFRLARFVIMTPPDGSRRRRACRGVPSSGVAANSAYRRREPDLTLLHQTVRADLKKFLAEMEQRGDGAGLPGFVVAEFERYLACGILANGFARVRCSSCGDELLVAFSCDLLFAARPSETNETAVLSCAAGCSPLPSCSARLIAMKEEEGELTELRLSVLPA